MTQTEHTFEPVWTAPTKGKLGYYKPGCTCNWSSNSKYESRPNELSNDAARGRAHTDWYRNHKKKIKD